MDSSNNLSNNPPGAPSGAPFNAPSNTPSNTSASATPHPPGTGPHSAYWRKTLRIGAALLLVWLLVTLAVGLFGRSLRFDFFGWPFGFWATSQGALLVYCAIIWIYAGLMNRLDRAAGDRTDD